MDDAENDRVLVPDEARCLRCGYRLRGLSAPVCPECGGEFDPQDLSTFDHDPRGRRRRRWAVRLGVWGGVGLVVLLAAPRGVLKSRMVLTCSRCGEVVTVTRWELAAPEWTGFRYPGFDRTSRRRPVPPGGTTTAPCTTCAYSVNVRVEMRSGWCSGTSKADPGESVYINGWRATPDTAPTILRRMMSRANRGIVLWSE